MFEKAVTNKPNYFEAIDNFGPSHQALGEAAAALEMFDRTLGIKSDYFEALGNKANALCEVGRLDASVQTIEQILDRVPTILKLK